MKYARHYLAIGALLGVTSAIQDYNLAEGLKYDDSNTKQFIDDKNVNFSIGSESYSDSDPEEQP